MNLKEQREAALKAARDIAEKAKGENRDLTADEVKSIDEHLVTADDIKGKIEEAAKSAAIMARISALGGGEAEDEKGGDKPARSLGEHFVKSIGGAEGVRRLKSLSGMTVAAPEYKAATDAHATAPYPTEFVQDVDKTIVRPYRRPAVIADLLSSGTMNGSSIKYFEENPLVDGGFATVPQLGQKPQMHFNEPTPRTDDLKKIAAWWDTADEMFEDLDFIVSDINNRALYLLSMAEEAQLLSGNGTGSNILGLLNRSGVQVEASKSVDDNPDAVFRALTKVQLATGLSADGIAVNPLDYQNFRLAKNANGEYMGGGFFYGGDFGPETPVMQPPLWGQRTIVSAAVPQGTAIVGAFKAAATVYRKGGVRVESTNSDQGKFTSNIVTTRVEERVGLAVRIPSAIVKVSLSAAA